jgi:hypothetical protein
VAEAKPFASLSSGLLARKGAARPAMKPQGFGQTSGGNLEDLGWNDMGFEAPKPSAVPLADATHDAFGEEIDEHARVHPTGLTPVQSPVHTQHAEIEDRLGVLDAEEEIDEAAEVYEAEEVEAAEGYQAEEAEPAPQPRPLFVAPAVPARAPRVSAPKPRAAAGSKAKAAFTLRLDPSRHLKLRLACAVTGRSAQQLVTDALDVLLADMPELDAMAEKANRKG